MAFTVGNVIREQAATRPQQAALTYEGRTFTFAELHERSSRVANALIESGVGPQEHVAYLDKNSIEYFDLLLGAGKANQVLVAVNWRLAPPEIAHVINDAQANVLVVGAEFLPQIKAIEDELGTIKQVVVVGEEYDAWLAGASATDPEVPCSPDDVSFQLYTSGTTGLPKGAMLTNENMGNLVPMAVDWWKFTPESVNLVVMPLFHIAGGGWGLVGITMGCHSVLMREVDPAGILRLIPEHRVTHALLVPAVLQFLLATPGIDETDFSSLEYVVYGASPITEPVLVQSRQKLGAKFVQAYGMTETTGAVTLLADADHDTSGSCGSRLRSCGKPLPWIELKVVDPESGEPVPTGEVGEVWTRSRQNMKGYWNNPDATAATILPDGWLRTGDAGFLDNDGFLFIHDRVKDMIISGGENIYPAEIENVLMACPGIADVAIIGVPDEKWGETVKAVVVKAQAAEVTGADIIAFARERLAHFKCPTSVDFTDILPRNPSGKLLKKDIREPYWRGQERRVH